jgi:two-component system, cell cycle response regulator DivK
MMESSVEPMTMSKRLLLVDDYADALEMWAIFLRSSGYDVITAKTGLEAIERAESTRPDLVLLDLQLPVMSGVEAARRLRASKATAHIPLIAVTGFSQTKEHDEARQAGFDRVIVKPCEPAALLAEVESILGAADTPA